MANKDYITASDLAFVPHPGATLAESLKENGMGVKEFATRVSKPEKTIYEIIRGDSSITDAMAIAFESVLLIPSRFWMNRQHNYDEYKARKELEKAQAKEFEWAKLFPYAEMVKYGYVETATTLKAKYANLLRFFRVNSSSAWEDIFINQKLKLSFRISVKNSNNAYALSAWLRQGEIMAENAQSVGDYSEAQLRTMMPTITGAMYDATKFLSEFVSICGCCGVKVIYIKQLKKAPVSGCVRWIGGNPCVFLTDRFKRYDAFCFSALHEIGHILKHGKKKDIFIEEVGNEADEKEKEADNFASQYLISDELAYILKSEKPTKQKIYRLSRKYKVNPGIIVGRLHHDKIIPYSALRDMIPSVEI